MAKIPIRLLTYETLSVYVANQPDGHYQGGQGIPLLPETPDSMVLADWMMDHQIVCDFVTGPDLPTPGSNAERWRDHIGGKRAYTWRIWVLIVQLNDYLPDAPPNSR